MLKFLFTAFIVTIFLTGCATQRGTINTFYEPSYQQGSISTLVVPTIRNARLAPSESQQIGRTINQAVIAKNPRIKIVSANKFSNFLNNEGLVDDYSDFIEDYVTSGIANREFLQKLANNGYDGIMMGELSNAFQQDGAYGAHKAQSRITIGFTVINTRTNDIVWTASADGIKGSVTTIDRAPPLIEAVNLAVDKIKESAPIL
ncbi:hypothetical protein N9V19_02225 [Opitutales bacterium]|nr:hypothetical protein [Opitutales bacterium]